MSIEAVAEATIAVPYRSIKLPPIGTPLPNLGGALWALQRAKPDSGKPDYAIIVPPRAVAEKQLTWGGEGKDEPNAACQWDGAANTRALAQSKHDHPAATHCAGLVHAGFGDFHLPSLRELHALYANGCTEFDAERWYWSSTQYSRNDAFGQHFGYGSTPPSAARTGKAAGCFPSAAFPLSH